MCIAPIVCTGKGLICIGVMRHGMLVCATLQKKPNNKRNPNLGFFSHHLLTNITILITFKCFQS